MSHPEPLKELLETVISFADTWGELALSAIATVLSIIAMVKSSKAEKLQNQVNTLELKLKAYELEKIEKEKRDALISNVEARVICIGRDDYRLKVWNSGNAPAQNVTVKLENNEGIFLIDQGKQPFEILEPRKNYELGLIAVNGSASKFWAITEWYDEAGEFHANTQMCDL